MAQDCNQGMKRAPVLSASLILAALLSMLSACGSVGTPAAASETASQAFQRQARPVPAAVQPTAGKPAEVQAADSLFPGVQVTAAVLEVGGRAPVMASLKFTARAGESLTAQLIDVSVESAPAGVSVRLLPISSGPDGAAPELTLPLEVLADGAVSQGTGIQGAGIQATAGRAIWLNVRQGAQVLRVHVPLLWASRVALPRTASDSASGSGFQAAATVPCGPDVYLFAPLNAPLERRTHMLRKTTGTGAESAVQSYDLNLAPTEGVTSLLCDPSGAVWLTLHSGDAQGSVIARFSPQSGQLTRFGADAAGDTLNNLTRTPDGRLWFVQYKRDRLGEFDPRTGRVITHAVAENAENLRLGQDGALYYSQFYAHPAVVRYDPATGGSTVMSVGTSGTNLPRAGVQAGGALWYVDAWTQTLVRIDPASGQLSTAQLPAGATPGELVASPEGTLWLADAARHVLYRLDPGSLEAVTVPLGTTLLGAGPLAGGGSDGPRALSVDNSGRLWYESGGQLIGQW